MSEQFECFRYYYYGFMFRKYNNFTFYQNFIDYEKKMWSILRNEPEPILIITLSDTPKPKPKPSWYELNNVPYIPYIPKSSSWYAILAKMYLKLPSDKVFEEVTGYEDNIIDKEKINSLKDKEIVEELRNIGIVIHY